MFEQVKLSYDFSALEPYIDTATMEVHYKGHHATYCKNFSDLIETVPGLKGKSALEILTNLDKIPAEYRTAVRNNGGGALNHNLYFESLSPNGGKAPTGALAAQIDKDFGDFETLCAALKKAALGQFGSGYSWLVYDRAEGKLLVTQSANQDLPKDGKAAMLLPIDVWEHAYYLKHKNKRADYLEDLFHVIDWTVAARRFEGE